MIKRATELFPLWAVLGSVLAFNFPNVFAPLKSIIEPLLGIVMFGMGITLTTDNFSFILKKPSIIIFGICMQFLLMPLIAWIVCQVFSIPLEFVTGIILVGCCPSGTASNVFSYLAKADLALSVTVTSLTNLLAFIATPFLTWFYIGQTVDVPIASMLFNIFVIVIIPVVLGVVLNRFGRDSLEKFKNVFPLVSIFSIILIIAIVVGLNRAKMEKITFELMLCVILHNLLGLTSGFWFSKALRLNERVSRTLSFEVGIQNSGLGVALAINFFSATAALPAAIFSVWQNLFASVLAGYWAKNEKKKLVSI